MPSPMPAWRAVALAFGLAACGAARPGPAPPTLPPRPGTPAPAGPELPALAPADLRVTDGDRLACTLAADGSITVDGAPFARMEARRVVAADGRPLAVLDPDGTLRFEDAARAGRLLADGAVEAPDGQRMALRDDGHVVFTDPAHPGDHVTLRLRVEGVTERARPAAAVLVGVLMFRARALAAAR
ncbi:MAG: hypothetical protein U0324_16010 [Polyangiales bacterium]